MYGGKLVETGDVYEIFKNPCHEYTKGLLASIPKAHEKGNRLRAIPGTSGSDGPAERMSVRSEM